jgi:hypothetical protein
MATNSVVLDNNSDGVIMITDDNIQCPPVIKEFFSNLSLNTEKNRWSSKCKTCSLSITDTYKTTSNFLKHLKNKHQTIFDEWKNNQDQSMKDKNQPKINNVFSPDREKCRYFLVLKDVLITSTVE